MTKQVDIRARLDEIKDRADRAEEGPWHVDIATGDEGQIVVYGQPAVDGPDHERMLIDGDVISKADAEFIAHARTDNPAMVAALTAVLDLENEPLPTGSEGDDWYGAGWNDALFNMKARITEAFTQSERR